MLISAVSAANDQSGPIGECGAISANGAIGAVSANGAYDAIGPNDANDSRLRLVVSNLCVRFPALQRSAGLPAFAAEEAFHHKANGAIDVNAARTNGANGLRDGG